MLKPGDCFLLETNLDAFGNIQAHLFVIVIEPQGATRLTIIVSANTLTNNKQDKTTVLEPGDHDFIMRRSYVNYHLAKIRELGDLENLISSGKVTKKPALRKTILSKICDGILRSSFTPFEVRELYRDRLFNSDDF